MLKYKFDMTARDGKLFKGGVVCTLPELTGKTEIPDEFNCYLPPTPHGLSGLLRELDLHLHNNQLM